MKLPFPFCSIVHNLYKYNDKLNKFIKLKNEIKAYNNMTSFPNKLLEIKDFFDENIEFYRIRKNKKFYDQHLIGLSNFPQLRNHLINFTNVTPDDI